MKEFASVQEAMADPAVLHIEAGNPVKGYEEGDELPAHCLSDEERAAGGKKLRAAPEVAKQADPAPQPIESVRHGKPGGPRLMGRLNQSAPETF